MEPLSGDPAVAKWLSHYPAVDRRNRAYKLAGFLEFLLGHERLGGLTPRELIDFQLNAEKNSQFVILDALQNYFQGKNGTYNSLIVQYAIVRSFFKKNRAALPSDDFQVHADRPPSSGRLTVEIIKTLVDSSPLGRKAFYLTLWQGLMDLERFLQFNNSCGEALTKHLKKEGVGTPFMFEYPGRKRNKNKKKFQTFIGRDALAAWKEYFERIRSWPREGEQILMINGGRGCTKKSYRQLHMRLLERLKYVQRGHSKAARYGYNLHEFRDVARTLLHLKGKGEGLDLDCVEYWMGHTADPNQYDKFYMDKNYTLEHYRVAEKYLNIMSGSSMSPQLQNAEDMIEMIIRNRPAFEKLLDALENRVGAKLSPVEEKHGEGNF